MCEGLHAARYDCHRVGPPSPPISRSRMSEPWPLWAVAGLGAAPHGRGAAALAGCRLRSGLHGAPRHGRELLGSAARLSAMWPFQCCATPTVVEEVKEVKALPAGYVVPKVWQFEDWKMRDLSGFFRICMKVEAFRSEIRLIYCSRKLRSRAAHSPGPIGPSRERGERTSRYRKAIMRYNSTPWPLRMA